MSAREMRSEEEERWAAVVARDRSRESAFVYGVLSTGVYCRPGCSSRLPKRENVRFYDSTAAAAADGLRACKRCLPDGRDARAVEGTIRRLCRYMEARLQSHPEDALQLADLAARAQLSPAHLQRTFRAVVGVSPKQYVDGLRMERFKRSLQGGESNVTDAIFDAGYGSISRVYERAETQMGMTPMEFREGGAGVAVTYAAFETAMGLALVGATDRGLCFLQFGESEAELVERLREQYPRAVIAAMEPRSSAGFAGWIAALNGYLEGRAPDLRLPVHVRATAFQRMVWEYLQRMPAGTTQSYREVAEALGRPTAARAVARACASNVVALAIPCHRVVRGTGEVSGYRWGVERKRRLLEMERGNVAGRTDA
ncbi:bifunctional transcriptional activator/DNA repair enzyme AdaA [Terriglobus aquaticus]|uniref:Bifunctional transcriptional activator/DNA repair enzyme AdaA n=1 Tax=Terriglobus aquaticus TaxID=940139 RepID=A0ABW9KHR5_9BACT|nr:methylated-DNA--[protein]-cysteine S-methyltransferase [Terriglobus aquaticus]